MPNRRHLQRLSRVWLDHTICFITICTQGRRKILAAPAAASVVIDAWRDAPRIHRWVVGRYVVMPDHVHFFAAPQVDAKTLSAFIRDWKKWTGRLLSSYAIDRGQIWQSEFFDHLLRTPRSYDEKWEYVRQNPVRAGLVPVPEAWPYAGEFEPLVLPHHWPAWCRAGSLIPPFSACERRRDRRSRPTT
jgi:REP element-mobilizing transposase RayT